MSFVVSKPKTHAALTWPGFTSQTAN